MICTANIVFIPLFILFFIGVYFWKTYSQSSVFLMIAAATYFFVCFIFLVKMNFIEPRYVFATSFFLYPWVGLGIEKTLLFKTKSRLANILLSAVAIFLFLLPFYESITSLEKQVVSGKEAGIWLSKQMEVKEKKIIANNGEIPFYSGRNSDEMIHVFCKNRDDFILMEQIGKRDGAEIIAIVINKNDEYMIPDFVDYELKKRIDDKKYSSFIFYRK
jgi:hypothetical protein